MAKLNLPLNPLPELDPNDTDCLIGICDGESHNRRSLTMEDYFKYLKQKCLEDGEITLEMKGEFLVMKKI